MDIAFGVNDGYVPYILVTICSVFENNTAIPITIHVLSDSLSPENKGKLCALVAKYNGRIYFYKVDNSRFTGLNKDWSIYAWYRYLVPELLPSDLEKVLYLDADTLVVGNLTELFRLDLKDKALGAVTDVHDNQDTFARLKYTSDKGYFCTGVILFNMKVWRQEHLTERLFEFERQLKSKLKFGDQDPANVVCQDKKTFLPMSYGILADFVLIEDFRRKHYNEIKEVVRNPKIIHFAGCAPWVKETNIHFMRNLYSLYENKVGGVPHKHIFNLKGVPLLKYKIKFFLGTIGVNKYRGLAHLKYLDVNKILK